jgi:hypothetical protein
MSRIYTEGFEMRDVLFWDVPSIASIATTNQRSGAACCTGGGSCAPKRYVPFMAEAFWRIGWRTNPVAGTTIWKWYAGSTELGSVRINSTTFKLEIYTGNSTLVATGTFVVQINTYYCFEIHVKIADSGGVIEVKIDGVPDVSFSGDTKPDTNTGFDGVGYSNGACTTWIDDLAMNDTTGSADNSWCGDGHIVMLSPNAAGDVAQLTRGGTNSGSDYGQVDEVPPNGDTDYLWHDTAGMYTLLGMSTYTLAANESVRRVYVEGRVREEAANGDSVQMGLKTHSAEYWGSNQPVTTTYRRILGDEYLVNPNTGVAWTQAELDALQAGTKIV